MAKTYIDLNEQGEAGSISDALINVAADIATSKLATFSSHSIADGALISYPSSQLGNFSALDLVDKEYVDSVAVGLSVHAPVDYATAAALPAYTYFNGVLGVGATLTGTSFGALTVDGHLVSPGQRILVSNETGGNSVAKLLASDGSIVGTYSVGSAPQFICFDGTNIWTSNSGDGTVTELLASTGAPIGTFSVGSTPEGITSDGTNIWVSNYDDNTVTALLISTGSPISGSPFPVGNGPWGICFDGSNIWVANVNDGNIMKLLA
jgi:hypothetical protein